MSIMSLVQRFANQYRVYGLWGAIANTKTYLHRNLLHKSTFLYVADLEKLSNEDFILPEEYSIVAYHSRSDIPAKDQERYFGHAGKENGENEISDRFSKNAILWMLRVNEAPAGFIWSVRGKMVDPYFVPLAPNDSVLFDAVTFPEFRGKRIYSLLTNGVILRLRNDGCTRAFGHAEEWNLPSINGLRKTYLKAIGKARKFNLFGRTLVVWKTM